MNVSADLVPSDGAPDRYISARTAQRLLDAVPENTKRAYSQQLARFEAWCEEHSRTPLPATAETLAEFVSHLCDLGKSPSTIDQAITAIRTQHRRNGFKGHPDTDGARLVLKAHRRARAESGVRAQQAPVIGLERLQAMVEAVDTDTLRGKRDVALLIIGFAMMGRRSELAGLYIEEAVKDPDGYGVTLLVRASKTDQAGVGSEVYIPAGVYPATDPVRVLDRYIAALAEAGITSGKLFRSISRGGKPGPSITPDGINRAIRAVAVRAGVPMAEIYSAHGLRSGGATSAYRRGAPVADIISQGRWSRNSTAVLGYIRAEDLRRDNPMRGIGL